MLEVGIGGLTLEEEKSHFALWAVSKAPLIIGADLSIISNDSLAVLMNEEIIAVNQDPSSEQARCVLGCSWWDRFMRYPSVWSTKLSTGEVAAVITNWREVHHSDYYLSLSDLGIVPQDGEAVSVRDLMNKKDIGSIKDKEDQAKLLIDRIPGHGSKMYKFKVIKA